MNVYTLPTDSYPLQLPSREAFYQLVNTHYPELGLTIENSQILHLQAYPRFGQPGRTRAVVVHNNDRHTEYVFYYQRLRISDYVRNPFFEASELEHVQGLPTDTQLLAYIAEKLGITLYPEDFEVDERFINYAGGLKTPNWRLKARHNSPVWYGEVVVHLHDGLPL